SAPRTAAGAASDGGRVGNRRLGRRGSRLAPAGRLRKLRRQNLVRPRVPLGDEPLLASVPVVPPLPLKTRNVLPEVEVRGQLAEVGRRAARAGRDITLVRELVDVSRAAVRARQQE